MGWKASDIADQHGRVVVVTGASSGLGLEAARQLARTGAHVVMGVRDVDRGQRAADGIRAQVADASVDVRRSDLASLTSTRAFAASVMADHDSIDLLLNNAGIMATPPRETADGFESQVGTNHLGHFALTRDLMPALTRARGARVVTMTSFARSIGRPLAESSTRLRGTYDPWQAYGDSKLANYHFAIELARRLETARSSVASLAAHPGLSRTGLQIATVREGGAGWQGALWGVVADWFGMSAAQGALSMLRAATDPRARNGELYGPRWLSFGAPVRKRVSGRSARPDVTRRMWEASEAAIGTTFEIAAMGHG